MSCAALGESLYCLQRRALGQGGCGDGDPVTWPGFLLEHWVSRETLWSRCQKLSSAPAVALGDGHKLSWGRCHLLLQCLGHCPSPSLFIAPLIHSLVALAGHCSVFNTLKCCSLCSVLDFSVTIK